MVSGVGVIRRRIPDVVDRHDAGVFINIIFALHNCFPDDLAVRNMSSCRLTVDMVLSCLVLEIKNCETRIRRSASIRDNINAPSPIVCN